MGSPIGDSMVASGPKCAFRTRRRNSAQVGTATTTPAPSTT